MTSSSPPVLTVRPPLNRPRPAFETLHRELVPRRSWPEPVLANEIPAPVELELLVTVIPAPAALPEGLADISRTFSVPVSLLVMVTAPKELIHLLLKLAKEIN